MKNLFLLMKRKVSTCLLVLVMLFPLISSRQAIAVDFDIAGKPVRLMGYISQKVQYGIAGDHYDTIEGFQSALTR